MLVSQDTISLLTKHSILVHAFKLRYSFEVKLHRWDRLVLFLAWYHCRVVVERHLVVVGDGGVLSVCRLEGAT